jgi:hypothetical protein
MNGLGHYFLKQSGTSPEAMINAMDRQELTANRRSYRRHAVFLSCVALVLGYIAEQEVEALPEPPAETAMIEIIKTQAEKTAIATEALAATLIVGGVALEYAGFALQARRRLQESVQDHDL